MDNDFAAAGSQSAANGIPILPPPPMSGSTNTYTPPQQPQKHQHHYQQNNSGNNQRLQETQAKVDEVVGIMRVNVEKVLERDQKLSELGERADALEHGAAQFEQQATKLKRKQWWANMKMMIIMSVIGLLLLILIIASLLPSSESKTSSP